MSEKKQGNGAATALIVIAFALLVVGMGVGGTLAYVCIGSSILLFLVAIVMQIAGAASKD